MCVRIRVCPRTRVNCGCLPVCFSVFCVVEMCDLTCKGLFAFFEEFDSVDVCDVLETMLDELGGLFYCGGCFAGVFVFFVVV